MEQIKVGDILAGTWGATMVIPCFYKVTKVTPKGFKMYEIEKGMCSSADGGFNQQGYEVPLEPHRPRYGELEAKEVYAKPCKGWDGMYETGGRSSGRRYVKKWDGKPVWADYMD